MLAFILFMSSVATAPTTVKPTHLSPFQSTAIHQTTMVILPGESSLKYKLYLRAGYKGQDTFRYTSRQHYMTRAARLLYAPSAGLSFSCCRRFFRHTRRDYISTSFDHIKLFYTSAVLSRSHYTALTYTASMRPRIIKTISSYHFISTDYLHDILS